MERVGGAGVLEVVDERGEQRGEDLQLREPVLRCIVNENVQPKHCMRRRRRAWARGKRRGARQA